MQHRSAELVTDAIEQLMELADRALSASPGSENAQRNFASILAICQKLEPGEPLSFFAVCKLKTHAGKSAALLITDQNIYVSATLGYGIDRASVSSFSKHSESFRLSGAPGGAQVLFVGGLGLQLDAQQANYLRDLGLNFGGSMSVSTKLTIMPGNIPGRACQESTRGNSFRTEFKQALTGVFISHASEDEVTAEDLAAEFKSQGVSSWLAKRDVEVGSNYAAQIHDAIVGCSHIVVVLSPAAIRSVHVQREMNIALDQEKAILPIAVPGESEFMATLPAEWKYWLGVVQILPYSSAPEVVRHIRSVGAPVMDLAEDEKAPHQAADEIGFRGADRERLETQSVPRRPTEKKLNIGHRLGFAKTDTGVRPSRVRNSDEVIWEEDIFFRPPDYTFHHDNSGLWILADAETSIEGLPISSDSTQDGSVTPCSFCFGQIAVDFEVVQREEGGGEVRCLEIEDGRGNLKRLQRGGDIAFYKHSDGRFWVELSVMRANRKFSTTSYLPEEGELDDVLGWSLSEALTDTLAVEPPGTRADLLGDTSRGNLASIVAWRNSGVDVPALLYVATRILPLMKLDGDYP